MGGSVKNSRPRREGAQTFANPNGGKPVTTETRIRKRCAEIADFLAAKNASYGDSALHPIGVFAGGDAVESLAARIDDKLARLKNAPGVFGEDTLKDLIGYLILLQLAIEDREREKTRSISALNT